MSSSLFPTCFDYSEVIISGSDCRLAVGFFMGQSFLVLTYAFLWNKNTFLSIKLYYVLYIVLKYTF